jgi:hypothetical protein
MAATIALPIKKPHETKGCVVALVMVLASRRYDRQAVHVLGTLMNEAVIRTRPLEKAIVYIAAI